MKIHKVMQNGKFLGLPEEMGTPRADQLQGTDMEKFAESCGRICYDSFGTGRASGDYHKRIKEENHLNIYEGCVLRISGWYKQDESLRLPAFAARTIGGLWLHDLSYQHAGVMRDNQLWFDLTINAHCSLRTGLFAHRFHDYMPMVFQDLAVRSCSPTDRFIIEAFVRPADWTSFYVKCSRCMSHELVRHRWQAHVSQRSTRYVDESLSPIHMHPELKSYLDQAGKSRFPLLISELNSEAQQLYDNIVSSLSAAKITRKQARGAARFVLPMGLETQLMFGASPEEWNNIIAQRANEHADAEIREFGFAVKEAL